MYNNKNKAIKAVVQFANFGAGFITFADKPILNEVSDRRRYYCATQP
jgi:hypothetical protein